jgi:DnaJ-class molecular chaperone
VIEIWPPGHDSVIIRLAAGTTDGQVLRIPDHGLPLPDSQEVGALLVTVAAGVPAPAAATMADPLRGPLAHT